MAQRTGSPATARGADKALAEAAGLHTDDRIARGIEILAAAEHFGRDGEALELPRVAGERFLHDEAQECTHVVRRNELRVREHPLELVANTVLGQRQL